MSDTPRTDEAEKYRVLDGVVSSDFARTLERELAETRRKLTAHKEVVGMCREIIEGCINNQPASEGGGMYYERFDGDGNYSGVEHVDPAAIYQATLDELHKALTDIAKLKEGK